MRRIIDLFCFHCTTWFGLNVPLLSCYSHRFSAIYCLLYMCVCVWWQPCWQVTESWSTTKLPHQAPSFYQSDLSLIQLVSCCFVFCLCFTLIYYRKALKYILNNILRGLNRDFIKTHLSFIFYHGKKKEVSCEITYIKQWIWAAPISDTDFLNNL